MNWEEQFDERMAWIDFSIRDLEARFEGLAKLLATVPQATPDIHGGKEDVGTQQEAYGSYSHRK